MNKIKKILKHLFKEQRIRFLILLRNTDQKKIIYALSALTGLVCAIAAVLLKNTLHFTHYFVSEYLYFGTGNFLYLAYPLMGLFLTVIFVNKAIKQKISHGVSRVLFAISQRSGLIKLHNTFSSIIASTLTIGFGGSVGAEAPIVYTGSAIGSNLGRFFKLDSKSMILLIGCGAAGAISGIFKAPIAGLVFCFEVLMLDLNTASLIPLLISSVTAATFAYFMMGSAVLFSFTLQDPFILHNVPLYILLGLICGFFALYFSKSARFVEKKLALVGNPFKRLLIGGSILGLLIYFFPPLYGEGYDSLKNIFTGNAEDLLANSFLSGYLSGFWGLILFLSLVLFFKVFAMSVTTGSGGVGGVFAPSLFAGGLIGFIIAKLLNFMTKLEVSVSNFSLVGMAGLMAGIMHAPLTAIFLIAELTGGYGLIIPLIITSTIAYITKAAFEKYSIYTKDLAEEGKLITHDKDQAALQQMNIDDLLETDFSPVHPNDTLRQLVKVISKSNRNVFPVIDENNIFLGTIFMNEIRSILFQPELYDNTYVHQLMNAPEIFITPGESMEDVAEKLSRSGHYNIAVIEKGKYLGFVSRANVFAKYRNLLKSFSES